MIYGINLILNPVVGHLGILTQFDTFVDLDSSKFTTRQLAEEVDIVRDV